MRIIVAACTDKPILVLIRAIRRDFTPPIRIELKDTQIMKTAIADRSCRLPLAKTAEKSRFVSLGVKSPTSVTASVAKAASAKSVTDRDFTICTARSFIPIFLSGKEA